MGALEGNAVAAGQLRTEGLASRVAPAPALWRRALRRHLALLLGVKFAALALLWALCFSPVHRTAVGPPEAARRLALLPPQAAPRVPLQAPPVAPPPHSAAGEQSGD